MKNFFVWKDVLYYDAYKRKVASDEVVVTEELLRALNIDLTLDEVKGFVLDRLPT